MASPRERKIVNIQIMHRIHTNLHVRAQCWHGLTDSRIKKWPFQGNASCKSGVLTMCCRLRARSEYTCSRPQRQTMRKQSSTTIMRYARSWDVWPRRERVMRCVAAVCAERGACFVRRVRAVCAAAPAPLRYDIAFSCFLVPCNINLTHA